MDTRDDEVAALRRIPGFDALDRADIDGLLALGGRVRHVTGATLFQRGERPAHLHILLDGQVALLTGAGTAETVVEVIHPVDHFMLPTVLLDEPYLTSARALADSTLLLLPAADLRQAIASRPALALPMLASLSRHYRLLLRQVRALKLQSLPQRLGAYLLGLHQEQGGGAQVRLPFDKRILAARLGASPEHLSRALVALQPYGVRNRGREIALDDPMALARFSDADALAPADAPLGEPGGHAPDGERQP